MCNKFITLVSLLSLASFSGLTAESKQTNTPVKTVGQPTPCCTLEIVTTNATSYCTTDGAITITPTFNAFPAVSIAYYLSGLDSTATFISTSLPTLTGTFNNLAANFTAFDINNYAFYTVSAVATDINGNCCTTACYPVIIYANNQDICCQVSICASSPSICPGRPTVLTAVPTSNNGGLYPLTYTWYYYESDPITTCVVGSGPTLCACSPGFYQVIAQSSLPCQTSCCQSGFMGIQMSPVTDFCICGNTSVCVGQYINLCVSPTDDNSLNSYSWTLNGIPTGDTTASYSLLTTEPGTGTICVTVTDTSGCQFTSCVCYVVNTPYTLTVPDQCYNVGCPIYLPITITPETPDFECCNGTTPPSCVQVIITGPGSFYVNETVNINEPICFPVAYYATEANSGWYTVTVIDPHGCVTTQRARIVVIPNCPCPTSSTPPCPTCVTMPCSATSC